MTDLEHIERTIARHKWGKEPDGLYEPIRYLMSLGGKRLRPMLVILAYRMYRNDWRSILPYAVAVEAFHNFTLMHDDIMDQAPLRRNKPTVHQKWNVNTAILSGDVMLVQVYQMLAGLEPQLLKEALPLFNRTAREVCEGQQMDMEFELRNNVTVAEYLKMIRLKTAVLLGFSLQFGALLAGAPAADQKKLYNLGIAVGTGFQLKDDLLDVYGDQQKFGKQVGGDIISNKKTFLLIHALTLAKGRNRKELDQWLAAREFRPEEKVKAVTEIYDRLNIAGITRKQIDGYFRSGFRLLKSLPGSAALAGYAQELMDRDR